MTKTTKMKKMSRFSAGQSRSDVPLLVLCLGGMLLGTTSFAQAQSDEDEFELFDDSTVLEEIIVTARKRQEALQDTPVAISALSADAIEEAGISDIRDLQRQVPGLNFSEQGSKNPSIFIRGVGQRESNTALDPGVGVYINNIYIARTDGQLLDTVDTESIQILRGPQGTLFGKNNVGGAVLVTTRAPHWEGFEGYASLRYGNFGRRDGKISANIPLNDNSLALRFSLNRVTSDGYLRNAFDGDKYADEDRSAASARLYWQASDVFSVDLFTYWSKQDEKGAPFSCFFANEGASLAAFSWPNPRGQHSFGERCRLSESLADDNEVLINGPSKFSMTNEIVGLTLTWEFDDIEFKSITAFSQQTDIVIQDDQDATDLAAVNNGTLSLRDGMAGAIAGYQEYVVDGGIELVIPDVRPTSAPAGTTRANLPQDDTFADFGPLEDEKRRQYSQEFQVIGSALDESLSYTVGVFYAKEDLDNTVFTVSNNYVYYPTDLANTLVHKIIGSASDLDNETYALFAQSTYDVNDWFQLTAGLRYTVEEREREASIYASNCSAIATLNLVPGANGALCAAADTLAFFPGSEQAVQDFLLNPPSFLPVQRIQYLDTVPDENSNSELKFTDNGVLKDSKRFTKVTPTLTAAFNLPEEIFENSAADSGLIYVTYSKGFKAGGFEMKGAEIVQFDPENVTNIEVGYKADFYENRVRFNLAAYQMDYEDLQVRIAEKGRGLADVFVYLSNAGQATLNGLEMETTALLFEKFTLQWSANYTDASYDEFTSVVLAYDDSGFPFSTEADRSKEPFGSIPELSYSLTGLYAWQTEFGVITPRLTLYYQDEVYTGVDDVAYEFEDKATIDDYTLLNLRIGYVNPSEKLHLALYVDNLTDEDYYQGGFTQAGSLGAATLIKGSPRAYGIDLRMNF